MRKPDKELSRDPWYALHNGSTREIEDVKDIRVGDFVYLHTADGQALAFKVGEVIPHPGLAAGIGAQAGRGRGVARRQVQVAAVRYPAHRGRRR